MNDKNRKIVAFGIIITVSVIFSYLIYNVYKLPKIAYVKSSELVYGYLGMKDAQKKQLDGETKLKENLDSLKLIFESEVNKYNATYSTLSKIEQLRQKEDLSFRENALKQYSKSIQDKVNEQDQELTSGVLNQINAFIEEYAAKNDYDLVLGTTNSGNILFAKDYMDITKEVLIELNKNYKPSLH